MPLFTSKSICGTLNIRFKMTGNGFEDLRTCRIESSKGYEVDWPSELAVGSNDMGQASGERAEHTL
jgi:hypothetical protein